VEEIKAAMEAFSQKIYPIFGKIYQQEAQAQQGAQNTGANDDGTVETDYTVH